MDAFDSIHEFIIRRTFNPIWPITEKFTGTGKQIQECKKILDDFAYTVINEKRANRAAGRKSSNMRKDLLDFFLEACNEDGSSLSDEYLRDMVVNFLVAGRGTACNSNILGKIIIAK